MHTLTRKIRYLTALPGNCYYSPNFPGPFCGAFGVNLLKVPLADVVSQGVTIDVDIAVDAIRPPDAGVVPVTHVHVAGRLSGTLEDVVFDGQVAGAFRQPCDRCLADTTLPFNVDVRWDLSLQDEDEWDGESDGEDSDGSPVAPRHTANESDEVDLRPCVWEEVVLALPAKYLCKEDCFGLCPVCGKELNAGPCKCAPQVGDAGEKLANKGFAGLADKFPNLKPRSD